MKILFIDNNGMSCNEKKHYSTNSLNGEFLNDLINEGHEIRAFQLALYNYKNTFVYDLEEHGIKCVPIKNRKNKILRYFNAYFRLIPEIMKSDFVYFYYPGSFKYATFICMLFRKKYGLYIRGMHGVDNKLSHMIYKKAYTIFTVSKFFTDMVNGIVGKELAHTIRPMLPYTDEHIITDRKYKEKKQYVLLYLGRIVKDKGIMELINAIKTLSQSRNYSVILKLVGYGDAVPEAKQLCKDLAIEDFVKFEGTVHDDELKKKYYLEADAYILPTYHEGFPRTLYEAMIFGTPIVTTFVGGIPTLMQEDFNCLKIEAKSCDSIIETIDRLFNNYAEEANKLCSNARKTVAPIVAKDRLSHGKDLSRTISIIR